jgi:hypothetical protein
MRLVGLVIGRQTAEGMNEGIQANKIKMSDLPTVPIKYCTDFVYR